VNDRQKKVLTESLLDPNASFNQKIREFIKMFNADSPDSNLQQGTWNVSLDRWQRYEFVGDRVLNLVAADYLYHQSPANREWENREGEMTKKMGVVSNESLSTIIDRKRIDIPLLIPETIGQQQTYGEKIKGGALEAFIGALYECVGFEVTRTCILTLLSEEIDRFDPNRNAKGILQEFFQKQDKSVPEYRVARKNGSDHKPVFTCRVYFRNEFLGEGTGESKQQAEQEAAKRALEKIT
jgi:ribonuclease-3